MGKLQRVCVRNFIPTPELGRHRRETSVFAILQPLSSWHSCLDQISNPLGVLRGCLLAAVTACHSGRIALHSPLPRHVPATLISQWLRVWAPSLQVLHRPLQWPEQLSPTLHPVNFCASFRSLLTRLFLKEVFFDLPSLPSLGWI